jgi:hypothetical protein
MNKKYVTTRPDFEVIDGMGSNEEVTITTMNDKMEASSFFKSNVEVREESLSKESRMDIFKKILIAYERELENLKLEFESRKAELERKYFEQVSKIK